MRHKHLLKKVFVISILVSILLTACSLSIEVPVTQIASSSLEDVLPPEVANEIRNRMNENLGVAPNQIQINTVEQRDWPDGCLGLAEPGETCSEAVTPGWLVVVSIDGQEYRYRVDQTGANIRQEL